MCQKDQTDAVFVLEFLRGVNGDCARHAGQLVAELSSVLQCHRAAA